MKTALIAFIIALTVPVAASAWEKQFRDFISDTAYNRYAIGSPAYDAETKQLYLQTTNGVFGGNIQDGGGSRYVGLTKTGSASLTLSGGANNYSGTTTIADGTLVAQGGSAIGDLSTVELADLATASLEVFASEQVGALSGACWRLIC